jgi:RNA polymerase sigma-70 factor (ECF subfamily)
LNIKRWERPVYSSTAGIRVLKNRLPEQEELRISGKNLIFRMQMDELTHRYIHGDPKALSDLYATLQSSLRLVAYHHCRDKETAKDLVQDIFEKLSGLDLETRASWFGREGSNLQAWLHVAVRHKAMDDVKIRGNRGKILESVRYASVDRESVVVHDGLSREGLLKMFECLQPRQREVMAMHIEGYKNEEIAESLRITYNTVKNNLYEGRQRLRRLWRIFME